MKLQAMAADQVSWDVKICLLVNSNTQYEESLVPLSSVSSSSRRLVA